jgi:hypothetical protein
MTLSDLLDGAFRVIKLRPRTVLGIAASILIPVFLLTAFLQRDVTRGVTLGSGLGGSTFLVNNAGSHVLTAYLVLAILSAAPFFLGGALGRLITSWYAGTELSTGQCLRAAFNRTPALLGAFFLLLPVKAVSVVVCYLPIIATVTLFSLTAPVIVVEGLGPYAGARRSFRLIARRFWPAVGVIVVATIGSSILSSVLGLIPNLLALLLPDPARWIMLGLVRGAVAVVVLTALTSVSVLLYLDLRIRTEGLDLELGAADAFVHDR